MAQIFRRALAFTLGLCLIAPNASVRPTQPTKLLKVLSGVSAKSIQRRLIFAASVVSTVETSFDFGFQNS
jgi:hypothetical protein